jgi:pimeloyl-ACP methyl ester carboxylesterase
MNWLFLRGLTREQRHWGKFKNVFQKIFPEDSIHCIDLPGVGTEYSRASPSSIQEISNDLRSRWLEVRSKSEGEWALLSISLGAMAGMLWAFQHPSDFQRVVLINSSAGNLNNPLLRLRGQMLGPILKAVSKRDPLQKEQAILKMTTNKSESEIVELSHEWANYAREYPMHFKVALSQITAALLFQAPPRLDVPALFINSKQDRFTSPVCSEKLAKHFSAPLITHESAGHDIPCEDPLWIAEQTKSWLSKLALNRS